MARIIIAVVYIAAILVIGILAGRNVKTSEEFATANRGIPFGPMCFPCPAPGSAQVLLWAAPVCVMRTVFLVFIWLSA